MNNLSYNTYCANFSWEVSHTVITKSSVLSTELLSYTVITQQLQAVWNVNFQSNMKYMKVIEL